MSGWLNTPVLISEGSRGYTETQTWIGLTSILSRARRITFERERYVGGDKAAADTKAALLLANIAYSDVSVDMAGGGQYHVNATKKTEGAWSAWAAVTAPV